MTTKDSPFTSVTENASLQTKEISIREIVIQSLKNYFAQNENTSVVNTYEILIEQVEEPLLHVLMEKYRHNQSKVSRILGLSRGTTRKLLKKYGLIS